MQTNDVQFRVTIEKVTINPQENGQTIIASAKIYEQIVDTLDMKAVMQSVNKVPRKPRTKREAP